MKLTQLERTATTCWGPMQYEQDHSLCPLFAAGTVAGAFDASFSASSTLELFALNLANASSPDAVIPLGKIESSSRFNKLAWSSFGTSQDKPYGIIAGGKEDGSLDLYNPASIIQSQNNASILHKQVHTGQLAALDFNPFQPNLLATGASQAEIFIWDLNNPEKPYSPGAKSPRLEDLTCLAWNKQVQHILASSSSNGFSVVWDLKNRREIMHLTSPTRKKITAIAWNPENATQLLTASDDDSVPAIYMWDLRNAHAPEKVLTGHSKGVLSLSWSQKDSDLLLSCGKDNRTLCWNPNTTEVIGEFPTSSNWVFDVQWCPKNPDLLSFASFDGNISFYTIQAKSSAGSNDSATTTTSSIDPFAPPPVQTFTLKQPPKWLRCPVGASFGFGNKLVTFNSKKIGDSFSNSIKITTFVPNPEFLKHSKQLEETLASQNLKTICQEHVSSAASDLHESTVWKFMEFINQDDARKKIVHFLGFDKDELAARFSSLSTKEVQEEDHELSPKSQLANSIVNDALSSAMSAAPAEAKDHMSDLFGGNSQATFDIMPSINTQRSNAADLLTPKSHPFKIFKDGQKEGLDADITRCIIGGDFASAVELCLDADRLDDALMLAVHGGEELLDRTQKAFYKKKRKDHSYLRIASSLSENNLRDIIENGDIVDSWKEILAIICTFASTEEFSELSSDLADRLRDECDISKDMSKKTELRNAAVLTYMVAGRIDKLVGIWIDQFQTSLEPLKNGLKEKGVEVVFSKNYAESLQNLIEKISIYRKLVPEEPRDDPVYAAQMKALGKEYFMYSWMLLCQGELSVALKYLNVANVSKDHLLSPTSHGISDLIRTYQYRLYKSLDSKERVNFEAIASAPFEVKEITGVSRIPVDPVRKTPSPFKKVDSPEKKNVVPAYAPSPVPAPVQKYDPAPVTSYNPPVQQSQPYQPPSYQQPAYQPSQQQPQQFYSQQYNQGGQSWNNQNSYNQPGYGQAQTSYNTPYGNAAPQQQQASKSMFPVPPPIMGNQQIASSTPLSPPSGPPVASQRPASNWNDPPENIMKSKPKKVMHSAAPISAPFSGSNSSLPPTQQPSGPPAGPRQSNPAPPAYGNQQGGGVYGAPQAQMPHYQQQTPEAVSSPVGHPVGDRSHIPEDHKSIFESLSTLLNSCKPNAGPPQRKVLDDVEKRLNSLFDKLNNEQVGAEAIEYLLQLSKSVYEKDWNTAMNIQQQMMTVCGSKEGTNWILGLKRLFDLARTLAA